MALFAKHKHMNIRIRQGLLKTFACATIVSTLAGGLAFAEDTGGGHGNGSQGTSNYTSKVVWATNDNFGPANDGTVTSVLTNQLGGVMLNGSRTNVHAATSAALNECNANYAARHDGDASGANCRVFAVGAVKTNEDNTIAAASRGYDQQAWLTAWRAEVGNKTYTHNGASYNTGTRMSNGSTIDSIASRETSGKDVALVVIVLASDQPIGEVPPPPPTKQITEGISADSMINTTTITTGTGIGGKRMTISDTITPNGVTYRIKNQRIVDTTTGQDISSQFTFNTPAPNNVATATWNGGKLPEKHDFQYILDIIVSLPTNNHVDDFGTVIWNDKPTGNTENYHFNTWTFEPNKAWVKWDNNRWVTMSDPAKSNKVGADSLTFLDGSKIGSAVNTVVEKHLAQAPTKFAISDDYTKADYIFDPDMNDIHVYVADSSDEHTPQVNDMVSVGQDVTSQFDITHQGTVITASMKADALKGLYNMPTAKQYTLLIGGKANYANGKGAVQVRKDHGVQEGEQVNFCNTGSNNADGDHELTNTASAQVNNDVKKTNEPKICGYVPPVKKEIIAESSQGGAQQLIDGQVVYKGQKVEYLLKTKTTLPNDLAYTIKTVQIVDKYDEKFSPDKQTFEITGADSSTVIPKSAYKMTWDDKNHTVTATFTEEYVKNHYKNGQVVNFVSRFEGKMIDDVKVRDNQWELKLDGSTTPSNIVESTPPVLTPKKEDTQKDASINIDGKNAFLGDTVYYRVTIDATQKNNAYKIWRLGMVDDYDEEYLQANQSQFEVLDDTGRDVTDKFNIQVKNGVVYAFAKLVDTEIPATGETIKGDPQPTDLEAYAKRTTDDYKPLEEATIDQALIGHKYTVVMPMTVIKVTPDYVVKNTATQITNDKRKTTNTVTNSLKDINPHKDVTVTVNGKSHDQGTITLNSVFLYRLDASELPLNRAYPEVTQWGTTDKLDTKHDEYTGQWAVYAQKDITDDKGNVIAHKGERIAGSNFESKTFKEPLFTASYKNGVFTVNATKAYLALASVDRAGQWTAWIQVKRIATADKVENTLTETFNKLEKNSNTVWTKTPSQKSSIHLEKFDENSGLELGDRDKVEEALVTNKDEKLSIIFRITNTGDTELKHLELKDKTIAGDGTVTDFKYPDNWDTLTLKPGESVDVKGTFHGMTQDMHTDRAVVTAKPIVPCAVRDDDPFDGLEPDVPEGHMCEADEPVVSNEDDWNAKAQSVLAKTGTSVLSIALLAVMVSGMGVTFMLNRRQLNGKHSRV